MSELERGQCPGAAPPGGIPGAWAFYQGCRLPEGGILRRDDIWIAPGDRGFMFADGVYEVLRSYEGRLFHAREHFARLRRSLSEVRIAVPNLERLEAAAGELLARNDLLTGDATVYIQITRGTCCPRFHGFPGAATVPTVYMEAAALTEPPELREHGVTAITVEDIRWARCDIKAIGLLPNVLARQQAIDAGAYEAIFVRNGLVTEGTHTNVVVVRSGVVRTHPRTNRILPGITLEVVLNLCRGLSIPVIEEPIPACQIYCQEEVFIIGTTLELTAVVRVDGRQIADGRVGSITRRLQAAFREHVRSSRD